MLPLLAHCGLGQALAIRLWPCGDRGVGRIWGPGALGPGGSGRVQAPTLVWGLWLLLCPHPVLEASRRSVLHCSVLLLGPWFPLRCFLCFQPAVFFQVIDP